MNKFDRFLHRPLCHQSNIIGPVTISFVFAISLPRNSYSWFCHCGLIDVSNIRESAVQVSMARNTSSSAMELVLFRFPSQYRFHFFVFNFARGSKSLPLPTFPSNSIIFAARVCQLLTNGPNTNRSPARIATARIAKIGNSFSLLFLIIEPEPRRLLDSSRTQRKRKSAPILVGISIPNWRYRMYFEACQM